MRRTTCNRDCPDACGILAEVRDGRVVRLRGDPSHPVTQGFLCFRTNRFLDRQYHPNRILKPLLRRGDRQIEIGFDEAIDIAAERLSTIRAESGPAAILHYRSGGSLGALKAVSDYFFEQFGPTTTKRGDICSGPGDAAQMTDFGEEDSNDVFDILHARHVINWGKNLHVSNIHLIPILKEARRRGTQVTLIDPVRTRGAELADRYLQIRPDGDTAFGLLVGRILFEEGRVTDEAAARCEDVDAFRALCFSRSVSALAEEADLSIEDARSVADALADGPTAILVGWGLQRRLRGGSHVRILDALSALSGNLGRKGGGVSFYYKRKAAFDFSFMEGRPAPRSLFETCLGAEILAAKDPPIRAIWVTAGNPVAMLPDSKTVARAFESTEFSVVVDAFPTDTTRRASLVLPTTTLLEDDDLLGAYGHHYLGVSEPVVPPPPGVHTDLEIIQALASRLGMAETFAGTARSWKARILARVADRGASIADLEKGRAVRSPIAPEVIFGAGHVETPSRKVCLITAIDAPEPEDADFPLWLLSNSTERSQSSQWVSEPSGCISARVHPSVAEHEGLADGDEASLVNDMGSLDVRVVFDAGQRRDVVIVPKGGHLDHGWAVNALVRPRSTDIGEGAAYLSTRVRLVVRSETLHGRG